VCSLFFGREWLFIYGYADLFCFLESCVSMVVSTRSELGRCCGNWYVGVELPSVGVETEAETPEAAAAAAAALLAAA
jgi:hypothetical protein